VFALGGENVETFILDVMEKWKESCRRNPFCVITAQINNSNGSYVL